MVHLQAALDLMQNSEPIRRSIDRNALTMEGFRIVILEFY